VAFFSIARGFGQLVDKVPSAMNTILFPRLTKTALPKEAAQLAARAFRLILVLLVIVGGIALALIKPAVYLLYGVEFLPLVMPFLILIPGVVIAGATSPFMQYFMSIDRADLSITLPLLPLVLQLVLSLFLIPKIGPEGAALAYTCGLVLLSFISTWMFLRISGCTLKQDLMIRRQDLYFLYGFVTNEARKAKRVLVKHQ